MTEPVQGKSERAGQSDGSDIYADEDAEVEEKEGRARSEDFESGEPPSSANDISQMSDEEADAAGQALLDDVGHRAGSPAEQYASEDGGSNPQSHGGADVDEEAAASLGTREASVQEAMNPGAASIPSFEDVLAGRLPDDNAMPGTRRSDYESFKDSKVPTVESSVPEGGLRNIANVSDVDIVETANGDTVYVDQDTQKVVQVDEASSSTAITGDAAEKWWENYRDATDDKPEPVPDADGGSGGDVDDMGRGHGWDKDTKEMVETDALPTNPALDAIKQRWDEAWQHTKERIGLDDPGPDGGAGGYEDHTGAGEQLSWLREQATGGWGPGTPGNVDPNEADDGTGGEAHDTSHTDLSNPGQAGGFGSGSGGGGTAPAPDPIDYGEDHVDVQTDGAYQEHDVGLTPDDGTVDVGNVGGSGYTIAPEYADMAEQRRAMFEDSTDEADTGDGAAPAEETLPDA